MSRTKSVKYSRQEEILGILLITLGILIFVSLMTYNSQEQPGNFKIGEIDNQLGLAGVYISYFLIQYVIGYPSFVFPVIIFLIGWNLFRGNELSKVLHWSAHLLIFAIYTSVILAIPAVTSPGITDLGFSLSGLVGGIIAQMLFNYLGIAGSIVVLLSLIMITVISATNFSISGLLNRVGFSLTSAVGLTKNKLAKLHHRRKTRAEKTIKSRTTGRI
ncbi:MAG: DNA translocase FtsK 4TM domain-containing protein [bacterium]